jgi:putative membrane protein
VGWGGWIVMTLTMLAFWSLVVFGVIAMFRGDREAQSGQAPRERSPHQILDERFARGEIDVDEYHARQGVLRSAQ